MNTPDNPSSAGASEVAPMEIRSTLLPFIPTSTDTFSTAYQTQVIEGTSSVQNAELITNCLSVQTSIPTNAGLTGVLVLEDFQGAKSTKLVDLSNTRPIYLPVNESVAPPRYPTNLLVSPHQEWLVYSGVADAQSVEPALIVQNWDGKQKYILPTKAAVWDTLYGWLNDEWLITIQHHDNYGVLDDIILLNPFSGGDTVMPKDYPGVLEDDYLWRTGWSSIFSFGPDLEKVVYLANNADGERMLRLWNIGTMEILAEISNGGLSWQPPTFSPSGEKAAFIRTSQKVDPERWEEELYQIDSGGTISRLTHLSDYFENSRIISFRWSPDEVSIAFWFWSDGSGDDGNTYRLAVLDLNNMSITDYCLTTHVNPTPIPPVWSPDNRYLAFGIENPEEGSSQALLINLTENYAAKLAEGVIPVGWMTTRK